MQRSSTSAEQTDLDNITDEYILSEIVLCGEMAAVCLVVTAFCMYELLQRWRE